MSNGIALPIYHIEAKPGTGLPRISGKNITVSFIADRVNEGWTVDEVCQQYRLTPGEVYAALSYYADHQTDIAQHEYGVEERIRRFVQFEAYP